MIGTLQGIGRMEGTTLDHAAVRRWLPALACAFSIAFTVGPILLHKHLPLVDLPNHVARLHVAAAAEGGPLSSYYDYATAFVPNSAADLIWRILPIELDVARFAQLVMAVYAVNLIASAMLLSRVLHGRWSAWPAAAGLLVFSGPFFWGFQNFVFSLPFCLYGLALWLAMEGQTWRRWRPAVFVPFAAMLYLMHFFALVILAIAVFGREAQRALAEHGSPVQRALKLCLAMVPFALPVAWLAFTILTGPDAPGSSRTEFGSLASRLIAFGSPLIAPNTVEFPVLDLLAVLGLGLLALCLSRIFSAEGPRLRLHPRVKGPAIALAVAAVLAPSWVNGVALVHIRVPVLLVVLLLAGTAWQHLSARQVRLLIVAFATLIASRGIAFDRFAGVYAADIAQMLAATEALTAGARVLPLRAPGRQSDRRFYHIQGLLVAEREVFVPTLFQGTHELSLHERWTDHAEPVQSSVDLRWILSAEAERIKRRPVFTIDWEHKFTHALLFDPVDPALTSDPRLEPIATAGRFTLFRVVPDAIARTTEAGG